MTALTTQHIIISSAFEVGGFTSDRAVDWSLGKEIKFYEYLHSSDCNASSEFLVYNVFIYTAYKRV
jgi:hypothetical protein